MMTVDKNIDEKTYSKFSYFWVFMLLCYSGNPFFTMPTWYKASYIVFSLLVVVLAFAKSRANFFSKFLAFFIPYVVLFLCQLLLVPEVKISAILIFVLKCWIGCALLNIIGDEFETPYIKIMFLVSLVSLAGYAYNIITGNVFGIKLPYEKYSIVVYTQLSGFEGFINRNSGMFWEPGAFQAYISLALVFLYYTKEIVKKKWYYIVLIAALLTTKSTTGYLVLAFLLGYFVIKNNQLSFLPKFFLLTLLVVLFVYSYYSLDFLSQKIQWETTYTADKQQGRIMDYAYFSELLASNWFFGASFVNNPSGNGFLSHIICLGIPGALYYYILVIKNLKMQVAKEKLFIFLAVVILCLQGEPLLDHPLFLGFPFIKLLNWQK